MAGGSKQGNQNASCKSAQPDCGDAKQGKRTARQGGVSKEDVDEGVRSNHLSSVDAREPQNSYLQHGSYFM